MVSCELPGEVVEQSGGLWLEIAGLATAATGTGRACPAVWSKYNATEMDVQ